MKSAELGKLKVSFESLLTYETVIKEEAFQREVAVMGANALKKEGDVLEINHVNADWLRVKA